MLFSVIIPTYNRAGFIAKTIRSVMDQSFRDFELIIVDDGSTDDTEKIIRDNFKSAKIIYYKKENAERGAARNFGVQKAKGDYVVFLDSDDLLLNNHLEEAFSFTLATDKPEVFRLNYYIQKPGSQKNFENVVEKGITVNSHLVHGNSLSCMGVFISRLVALQNPFNENRIMSGLEDWELWLRLATRFPIYNIRAFTGILVHHDDRSVLETDVEKLIRRVECFMECVLNNREICDYYKNKLHVFKASCYSYTSLHIAMMKKKRGLALKFLFRAIRENPGTVSERRFFAILKNLLT